MKQGLWGAGLSFRVQVSLLKDCLKLRNYLSPLTPLGEG